MTLTVKQVETYHFIRHYILRHGFAPTEREIAKAVSISSRGVVHRYVRALAKAGYIDIIPNKKRNIALISEKDLPCTKLPLIGKIATGQPLQHVKQASFIDYSKLLLNPNHFVTEVPDDAMKNQHIRAGDYIVYERSDSTKANELAVIVINGSILLKKIRVNENQSITIFPNKPSEKPPETFSANQITHLGIYRGLIRMSTNPKGA